MTMTDLTPVLQHFSGAVVDADYRASPIPGYQNNPLIEALPPILTAVETISRLRYEPEHDDEVRQLPTELRLHLLHDALRFFKPLPVHVELEQRLSRLIRAGYQGRNPLVRGFRRQMDGHLQREIQAYQQTRSQGFTLLGMSGVGKTTALEGILSLYPQTVIHRAYHDQSFSHLQIVWLKLDCPHDGSIRGLCLHFFQAVDGLLDTRYYRYHARNGRATTDEMLPAMARVSAIHSLGVLVLDEIQHLSEARSGGAARMLNFFVHLVNTIGMPVVLVGTPKAQAVLQGEFRQARRGAGQGDLVWNRMEQGAVWDLFLGALWRYQFTRHASLLTPELSQTLYDETQGITDLAVKVYMLAQIRAMTTGRERVTAALIHSVAADSLRLAQPMLAALRSGDRMKLAQFEDIQPLDIAVHIRAAQAEHTLAVSQPTDVTRGKTDIHPNSLPVIVEIPREGLLAVEAAADHSMYEWLKQAGYIRSLAGYLEGDGS
jgi:hypothetical protein